MSSDTKEGKLIVMSAPAGTGKTTLVRMLCKEFSTVEASISYTTRPPRPGEVDGTDYYFVDTKTFETMIAEGKFLEYIKLYNTFYGTSIEWVDRELKNGKNVVLVIDTQGGLRVKKKVKASFIFILPPSIEELRRRLLARNTETEQVIEERLACAAREIEQGQQYDYKLVNDKLEDAYQNLKSIFLNLK